MAPQRQKVPLHSANGADRTDGSVKIISAPFQGWNGAGLESNSAVQPSYFSKVIFLVAVKSPATIR